MEIQTLSQKICCPKQDIRHDYQEGIVKCIKCGVILEDQIYISESTNTEVETPIFLPKLDPSLQSAMKIVKQICNLLGHETLAETAEAQLDHLRAVFQTQKVIAANEKIKIGEENKDKIEENKEKTEENPYKQMKSFKGYSMRQFAVAVLFGSIKLTRKPVTLAELCKVSDVHETELTSLYLRIQPYLGEPESDLNFKQRKEYQQMMRHTKNLKIEKYVERKAEVVLKKIVENQWLSGKKEKSKIAVAIYAGVKRLNELDKYKPKDIALEVGVDLKTIKRNFDEIEYKLLLKLD